MTTNLESSSMEEEPLFATSVPAGGLTTGLQAIAALIDESEEVAAPSRGGGRKRKADSLGTVQVHLALSGFGSDDAKSTPQRRRCSDVSREAAVVLVEALLSSPVDLATQLSAIAKLAEIACAPDAGSAWQAGAIAPCVSALSRFNDVTICWKACAVLQFIALHSDAAAADCVDRGAVHAIASRLVKPDDVHTKSFEMKWRALSALQALCAADGPTGTVATTQLKSCAAAGLADRLRAIVASAEEEARNELLLEPAAWLLDRAFGTRVAEAV